MRLGNNALDAEDGFRLGFVAVQCSGPESEALVGLPDVHHPLLDVYEVRRVSGRGEHATRGVVIHLGVQVARSDATSLEVLLRRRLDELVIRNRARPGKRAMCGGRAGL